MLFFYYETIIYFEWNQFGHYVWFQVGQTQDALQARIFRSAFKRPHLSGSLSLFFVFFNQRNKRSTKGWGQAAIIKKKSSNIFRSGVLSVWENFFKNSSGNPSSLGVLPLCIFWITWTYLFCGKGWFQLFTVVCNVEAAAGVSKLHDLLLNERRSLEGYSILNLTPALCRSVLTDLN